jgi:hypothetical protein
VYVTGWVQNSTITLAYNAASGIRLWQRSQSNSNGFMVATDPNGSAVFVTGQDFGQPPKSNEGFITIAYSP